MMDPALAQVIRQIVAPIRDELVRSKKELAELKKLVVNRPRTVTEEIDAIPGRRVFFSYVQDQAFDITMLGQLAADMTYKLSQDGPFVMTHYPLAMWKPSAPANTPNLGRWRPVATWPLPVQTVTTDVIDLSYQMSDGGSQRNFQDNNVPAGLLSRPDNMIPLPVPTLFTPNTAIIFKPFYEAITFDGATHPPTEGILVVALPGYKIVNM